MLLLVFIIISIVSIIGTFLPFFPSKHWFFRDFDYVRSHLLVVNLALFMLSFFWEPWFFFIVLQALLFISFLVQFYFIYPFINFSLTKKDFSTSSDTLSVLSINVHQNNNKYSALVDLIKKTDSDIVFTMETNKIWEENISEIESIYPYTKKVALEICMECMYIAKENFYSVKFSFLKVTKDRPCI